MASAVVIPKCSNFSGCAFSSSPSPEACQNMDDFLNNPVSSLNDTLERTSIGYPAESFFIRSTYSRCSLMPDTPPAS